MSINVQATPTNYSISFYPNATSSSNNSVINLKNGDGLNIAMPENPTTGYVWMQINPYANLTLKLNSTSYTYTPDPTL